MAYRVLVWFLRVVTRVFFRQVEVVGLEHVPADGPVLFAGNHPNSLIDPILILTTCGRVVHFAAKDTLFRGRLMRGLLRGLGAVPVRARSIRTPRAIRASSTTRRSSTCSGCSPKAARSASSPRGCRTTNRSSPG